MKNLSLILVLGCLTLNFAHAGDAEKEKKEPRKEADPVESISLPASAVLVHTHQFRSDEANRENATKQCRQDFINLTQQAQMTRFNESEMSPKEQAQYECKSVYLEFANEKKSYSSIGGVFISTNVYVKVYCDPRTLREKQVMSLQKACEKDPKAECFSETFLKYMDSVKPTKYFKLNKPSC